MFLYLDHFIFFDTNRTTIIKISFSLYKDTFFKPLKNHIFHALTNYFKEIDKIDNEENVTKINKIFKLMLYNDKISNPKIVKTSNNEFIWENEEIESINHIPTDTFSEWFNYYFLPDIKNTLVIAKDLQINEYIPFIFHFEYPILQKYFDPFYYNKILSVFIEIFIKENEDKIEEYFFNLNRNELKKVYEENKTSKRCVQLIYHSFISSFKKKGKKTFENKGVKINKKKPNKCLPIDIKNELDKLFLDCFDKTDQNYDEYLNRITKLLFTKEPCSKELSSYINNCLINKFKGKSEKEIKNELKEIIQIFVLLSNKSVFQTSFEKQMSERLNRRFFFIYKHRKKICINAKEEGREKLYKKYG